MYENRLRSIVPMFGGATSYVDTLRKTLSFVSVEEPSTDELVEWHRDMFSNVSSRDSILRRVNYLEDVGFLEVIDQQWRLGKEGRRYRSNQTTESLLKIMCRRNVGLRSLLYALTVGPMSIEEVSEQQLHTHPELGWNPSNTDMAKQRVNWLRSLGLVAKSDQMYRLTREGREFTESAIEEWATRELGETARDRKNGFVGEYESTSSSRALDPEFRATVLFRYDTRCPVSNVDHSALLDVAHILPWSDYPDHRADLENVLPLSKLHHAAFDRGLFTIDREFQLCVNPEFETECDILKDTLHSKHGKPIDFANHRPDPKYLKCRNANLDWDPAIA